MPIRLDITIDIISAAPTHPATARAYIIYSCLKSIMYPVMNMSAIAPRISPLASPTLISLKISLIFCANEICSSISTRIVTASDCVPTLPAMSSISDWKHTISVSCCTIFSNTPTTVDTPIPRNRRSISHGSLFLIPTVIGSSRSDSSERPASLA